MKAYRFIVKKISLIIYLIAISISQAVQAEELKTVNIALSSSIHKPLADLCQQFTETTQYQCKLISASTGHLYAHIMHGAQYDLLISSNETYAQALINANKAQKDNRFVLAIGRVVLWSAQADLTTEAMKEKLMDGNTSVAIANPTATPYGLAAKEILQGYNIWHRMQGRIVYGGDLNQTFDLVNHQQVPIGFVSLSHLSELERQRKHYWEPDPNSYHPVLHEVVLLKPVVEKSATQAFVQFIQSRMACEVLQEAGYQCWAEYAYY